MQGLEHANRLMDPDEREVLVQELHDAREKRLLADEKRATLPVKEVTEKKVRTISEAPVFIPKDLNMHVLKNYSVVSSTTLCEYAYIDWPPFRAKRKRKH